MDVKKEFVLKALDGRPVFTELCREYGISTKCGYKRRERFLEEGYAGLEGHSRKPHSNSRGIPEPASVEILRIKKLRPARGAKKIPAIYKRNRAGKYAPARGGVENLFARAGYAGAGRRVNLRGGQIIQNRVTPEKPDEARAVGFKGRRHAKNKEKVNPPAVRGEYGKYLLAAEAAEKGDTAPVKRAFQRIFRKYGLPKYIRGDNGPPFANVQLLGINQIIGMVDDIGNTA